MSTADQNGWMRVAAGFPPPDSDRDVLVWHGVDQMPLPAFFDADECSWFSKVDGCQLDEGAVTHWREIEPPVGGSA